MTREHGRLRRMLIRLTWLIVVLASYAWPSVAHACSCGDEPADLPTALRMARAEAIAIYRARILSTGSRAFGGKASVEVLEVFKGAVKPGDRLEVPSGGGGDCTIGFEAGAEYLMYAHDAEPLSFGKGPASVWLCTRTRPVSAGDPELIWLRTGQLPPEPVALQRESVSCEPCDIDSIGGRLIRSGAPPHVPEQGSAGPLSHESHSAARGSWVGVKDGPSTRGPSLPQSTGSSAGCCAT